MWENQPWRRWVCWAKLERGSSGRGSIREMLAMAMEYERRRGDRDRGGVEDERDSRQATKLI